MKAPKAAGPVLGGLPVLLALIGLAGGLVASVAGLGQASSTPSSRAAAVIPGAAGVPFGPGEHLVYQVKMGALSVGEAHLEVEDVDSVRGHPTYRVRMQLEGGVPFARVDDDYQSWFDVRSLVSRRFVQDIKQVRYESFRHYEIYPERRRWERIDIEESERMITSTPLDDVSFMYFVRTLDLTPGEDYSFNRYFKEDGNPVVIRVVGRDTVEVPAGTFETVVIKPIIQTDGLFGEGGEAELHFTDDARKMLVYMRVRMPVVRSMSFHLTQVTEGTPVLSDAGPITDSR